MDKSGRAAFSATVTATGALGKAAWAASPTTLKRTPSWASIAIPSNWK
jgi:hypothetical protein